MTFTVEQLAARWQTSVDNIRRKAAAGSIPAFKPGRRWRFDPEMIQKYERGEWRSTKEQPGVLGGLDSRYAVNLFAEVPARQTGRRQKNSKPLSASGTGDKRS